MLRVLSGADAEGDPPPDSDIGRIVRTYHAWRGEEGVGEYADEAGFCKAAKLEEIEKHGHVLTPGRYVGAAALRKSCVEELETGSIRRKSFTVQASK